MFLGEKSKNIHAVSGQELWPVFRRRLYFLLLFLHFIARGIRAVPAGRNADDYRFAGHGAHSFRPDRGHNFIHDSMRQFDSEIRGHLAKLVLAARAMPIPVPGFIGSGKLFALPVHGVYKQENAGEIKPAVKQHRT
jgi:hypothetical protein